MKKIISIMISALLVAGCSFMPWSAKSDSSRKHMSSNVIKLTKRQAIEIAASFLKNEGFGDEFRISKASKIKKRLTMEVDAKWVWQVYFPSKNVSMWRFWRGSSIMVEVNAETGQVFKWGRR